MTAAAGVAAGVPAEGAVASVLGPAADPVERVGDRGTIRSWELPGTVSKARHAVSAPTPPGHRKPGDEAGKSPVERVRVHAAILEMAIRKVGTAAGSTNVPATATASTACPRGVNAPSALAQTRLMLRAPDTTSISRLSARSGTAGIRRCVTQTAELAPNAARMITSSALPSSGTGMADRFRCRAAGAQRQHAQPDDRSSAEIRSDRCGDTRCGTTEQEGGARRQCAEQSHALGKGLHSNGKRQTTGNGDDRDHRQQCRPQHQPAQGRPDCRPLPKAEAVANHSGPDGDRGSRPPIPQRRRGRPAVPQRKRAPQPPQGRRWTSPRSSSARCGPLPGWGLQTRPLSRRQRRETGQQLLVWVSRRQQAAERPHQAGGLRVASRPHVAPDLQGANDHCL